MFSRISIRFYWTSYICHPLFPSILIVSEYKPKYSTVGGNLISGQAEMFATVHFPNLIFWLFLIQNDLHWLPTVFLSNLDHSNPGKKAFQWFSSLLCYNDNPNLSLSFWSDPRIHQYSFISYLSCFSDFFLLTIQE